MIFNNQLMSLSSAYTDTHFEHAKITVSIIAWGIQHILGSHWQEKEKEILSL